ncbi:unnamed protein product, partial [Linum tenue]
KLPLSCNFYPPSPSFYHYPFTTESQAIHWLGGNDTWLWELTSLKLKQKADKSIKLYLLWYFEQGAEERSWVISQAKVISLAGFSFSYFCIFLMN